MKINSIKSAFIIMCIAILLSFSFITLYANTENPFIDVPENKWYTKGVLYCYEKAFLSGTSDINFSPNMNMSRAMFVLMLAKIDGADLNNPIYETSYFNDVVTGKWFSKSISWAFLNGYASGIGDNCFGPSNDVTREQIAVFLHTYADTQGWNTQKEADLSVFHDNEEIHSWAYSSVSWAVASSLISGTGNNMLSPQKVSTRAEVAVMTKNFVIEYKDTSVQSYGNIGEHVSYILYKNGFLDITGNGSTFDYSLDSPSPFLQFNDCITSVSIEDSVTSLGDYLFRSVETLKEVSLPKNLNSVGNFTFEGCLSLNKIDLPQSLTSIGEYAFSNCSSIKSIIIPEKVSTLYYYIFNNCTSLENVGILSQIPFIPTGTFNNCSSLNWVYIPYELNDISANSFSQCNSLQTIYYRGTSSDWSNISISKQGNEILSSVTLSSPSLSGSCGSNAKYAYFNNGYLIITGTGAIRNSSKSETGFSPVYWHNNSNDIKVISINEGITTSGNYSFAQMPNIEYLHLPDSLTTINTYMLYESNLDYLTIPDSIKTISQNAFNGSNIKSISLPDGITTIPKNCFKGCKSLTEIDLPNNLSTIDTYAFSGCSSLKNIILPDTLKTLSGNCFENCSSLESITIPASVTTIDNNAFINNTSLNNISVLGKVSSFGYDAFNNTAYYNNENNWNNGVLYLDSYLIEAKNTQSEVIVKDNITTIVSRALYGNTSIENVSLPDSLRLICSEAFENCSSIKKINIPKDTILQSKALMNCSSLTEISLPDNLTYLPDYCMYGCSSITAINLPTSLTTINQYAFYNCSALENINFNNALQNIGDKAFENCSSLRNPIFNNNLVQIGSNAFSKCTKITSVTFPVSLKTIKTNAFNSCTSLTSISIPDTNISIAQNVFAGTAYYNNKKNWSENVLYIGSYLIEAKGDQETYTIKPTVKYIVGYAFTNKNLFLSLEVPEGVECIQTNAFNNAWAMYRINLPVSLKTIEASAFFSCTCLNTIYYAGSEDDWNEIDINPSGNSSLSKCAINYNS